MFQGIDLVDVEKFRNVFFRHEDFEKDIFTASERKHCAGKKNPYRHFAGLFAAKEACAKALGLGFFGFGIDHRFLEIEVLPDGSSYRLRLRGRMDKQARRKHLEVFSVALTETGDYALAAVVLSRDR